VILTGEQLQEILNQADAAGLREFFRDTREDQRRPLAKTALSWFKKCNKGSVSALPAGGYGWRLDLGEEAFKASLSATLVTASAEELRKLSFDYVSDQRLDWELLAACGPPALRGWGEVLIGQNVRHYLVVRKLMKLGLCDKPVSDQYIVAMIAGMRAFLLSARGVSLKEALLAEPDLLETDIWRLFEVEGDQENSLAAQDKYSPPGQSWESTLCELAREKAISRARLLDASLEALQRDFIQFRSGWFSRFHESLTPTLEERRERTQEYGKLIGSSIPTTVSFAVKALAQVDRVSPLSEEFLSGDVAPALSARSKSVVFTALTMLERAVKRNSGFARQACEFATEALLHESPEVQMAALDMIEKYGDGNATSLRSKIVSYRDSTSPSASTRIVSWLGEIPSADAVAARLDQSPSSPALQLDNANPTAEQRAIQPIEGLEELVAACASCLEHPDVPMEMERVVDGVSRLCGERPPDFVRLTAPLSKRAGKILGGSRWSVGMVRMLRAAFVDAWLSDRATMAVPFDINACHPIALYLYQRLSAVCQRANRHAALPLLSLPTHAGGWIEPAVLHERLAIWASRKEKPDSYDQTISLLRLPGLPTLEFLAAHSDATGEFWAAARHAAGAGDGAPDIASPLWIAASAARTAVAADQDLDLGSGGLYKRCSDFELLRWQAILFPSLSEWFFAAATRSAGSCIDYMDTADRSIRAYLEVLCDSRTKLGSNASQVLAAGLIVVDAECRGHARDAVIAAVDDGRLDIAAFSSELSRFLFSDRSKPARLSRSLSEVARVSTRHARAVRLMLQGALRPGGRIIPRDLSPVLELLRELLVSEGATLEDDQTRALLQGIKTGGKTGRIVKELLR